MVPGRCLDVRQECAKKAWVTLLTNPEYLVGVRALHQSLRRSGSCYSLVVMVTEGLSATITRELTLAGCEVVVVRPLKPPSRLIEHYASARFAEVWTKLRAWQLTQFERVVFLDADTLVLQHMDELMGIDLPENGIAACHACRCNPHGIAGYPASWRPENCFYYWLDRRESPPAGLQPYFNSGVLVLEPNATVMLELERRVVAITDLSCYPFPEQDLLNQHFRGRWLQLPYTYNALKTLSAHHAKTWKLDEVQLVHYILKKPWQRDWQETVDDDPYFTLDQLWLKVSEEVEDNK